MAQGKMRQPWEWEQNRNFPRLPTRPQRPHRNRKVQVHPKLHAPDVLLSETSRTQLYGSHFLPGKLAGKVATFLLDTGCTTNLLSRCVFDTFSAENRAYLETYEGEHGMLADGSCILFYGVMELTGQFRDQVISEAMT